VIKIHEKVKEYIEKKYLEVKYIRLNKPFKNVKESSNLLMKNPNDFVKSVVFDDNGKRVIAIILGNDRVNFDKLSEVTGSETISIVKPHEVMDMVGFPAGKVPPFGFNADFLIDSKVLGKKYVYAGAGTEDGLIKISPNEIIRANNGKIVDICD
jgi:prolyl-tRNA editing enzyme YbaK/EbsC (Cys-tRNA(Pro) deacylase)